MNLKCRRCVSENKSELYRIKTSTAFHSSASNLYNNGWQTTYTQDNRYSEAFTYDWNGNIKTVDRYSGDLVSGTAVKSDAFTYNYATNSNLLTHIDDSQAACAYTDDVDDQSGSNYLYDAIGEMTDDVSERIIDIEWTPYGKVKAVRKDQSNNTNSCTSLEYTDSDVEFLYTASQQRLCKIVKPHKPNGAGISDQDQWIYYWYSYDAGGNLMGVYKQSFEDDPAPGTGDYIVHVDLQEHGVYGSGRTGIRHADDESDYKQHFTATKSGGKFNTPSYGTTTGAYNKTHYTRTIGYKQYEVSNHLGNVLVTVSDKRLLYSSSPSTATTVEWYVADVQSFGDYYVFGAMQTGRAGGSYRYGFNGMEHDAEMKNDDYLSYTTEFRQYDPRVGRWMSVDPIVKDWESPYAGFANNPIFYVDPSGLDPSSGGDDPQVRHSNNTNNGQAKAPDGSSAVPLGATKLMYYTSSVRTLNGWDYAVEPGSVGAYEYNGATYGALYKDGVFIGYTLTADSPPPVSPAIAPRVAQATADVGVSINCTPLFEEAAPEQKPEDIPTHWILPSQEQLGCDFGDPTTGFSSNFGRTVNAYSDGLNGFATFIEWNVVAMTVFMGGGEAALAKSIVGGTVNRGIPRVVTKVVTETADNVEPSVARKIAETSMKKVHGNSLSSTRPTWGYKLYEKGTNKFLKNGITSKTKPESRYTRAFMSDKYMDKVPFTNRRAAYEWEFQQNQILQGPLNLNMH